MFSLTLAQKCYLFQVVFLREVLTYRKRFAGLFVNFFLIQTTLFALTQGYIKPLMYFGANPGRVGTVLFLGSIIMMTIHRSFNFGMSLFYDLNKQKVINVQIQQVPLYIVYLARFSFATLMSWVLLFPVYPIAKLLLGDFFYTVDANWLLYAIVLFFSCALLISYTFLVLSVVTTMHGITALRLRLNEYLMWFGGFNAPWWAMYQSGAHWGYIALANPLLYATEAIRQVITPGDEFFPLSLTIPVLILSTLILLFLGYISLKKRLLATENYSATLNK